MKGQEILNIFESLYQKLQTDSLFRYQIEKEILRYTNEPATLNDLVELFNPEIWKTKLQTELPLDRALDDFHESSQNKVILSYQPLGTVLHISPGNSFLGGVDSLLHGLITGNKNIVRISEKIPNVISLLDLPPDQVQVVQWHRDDKDKENFYKNSVNAIAVWGSLEAIEQYRKERPSHVELLEFGPRFSFSVISQKGLENDKAIEGVVKDICLYEQVSCSSTQAVFVEGDAKPYLDKLTLKMNEYCQINPPKTKNQNQQIEILKFLEQAKLQKSQNQGDFRENYPNWVLNHSKQNERVEPSTLFRTARIYSYKDLDELKNILAKIRSYLQTASLAIHETELMNYTQELWSAGVNRVVQSGNSLTSTPGSPHDGDFLLSKFCRITSLESPQRATHLWSLGSKDLVFKKIKNLINTARKAPFYQSRLPKIKSWQDFEKIPWLTKNDFYQHGLPSSKDLLTDPENLNSYLFTTGGSTGEPKFTVYSKKEWGEVTDIFCQEFKTLGLTSQDRFANLFTGGGLWSAFIAVTEGAEKLGCMNFPIGSEMKPSPILDIFEKFQITAVFGLPSTLLRLAHLAKEKSLKNLNIKKILYGGEAMSPAMTQFVKDTFNADIVKSGSYAAVDAGCIGYQCPHLQNTEQHVLENYCYVEICDIKTGKPVRPGETGEIIVTNLSRTLQPVIRLRTGDLGRQIQKNCACGSPAFTFELLGRSDDMVRAGGANIFVSDIDKLCQSHSQILSLLYQLEISKRNVDDAVTLKIETNHPITTVEKDQIKDQIQEAYLEIADELSHYLKNGALKHFDLQLLPPGSLKGNEKTGKIRRVVDLRFSP